jgi:hypothetical protein
MLEPIPFAGMVEIGNDKSLVEQAPYHPGYEDAGFQPTKLKELTDEEILKMAANMFHYSEYKLVIEFARAVIKLAQAK